MNKITPIDIVQVLTSLAVLFGLLLVVWELEQSRDMVKAQLTSEIYSYLLEQHNTMMGEDASFALAKACEYPAELTLQEKIVLENYYSGILNRIRRAISIQQNAGFSYMSEAQLGIAATQNFLIIFTTEFGRWWWSANKPRDPDHILNVHAEKAVRQSNRVCAAYFRRYDQWIEQEDHDI